MKKTLPGFRDIISRDNPMFSPEYNRYHLYVSLACPYASRCLMALKLKGLDACIGKTIVHPMFQKTRPENPQDSHIGWAFADSITALSSPTGMGSFVCDKCSPDSICSAKFVRDLYEKSDDRVGPTVFLFFGI
jgi:glutathionyl-hydroquinone reductase